MLNHGVEIKTVSRWLGHTRVETTEKYYGHANQGTDLASEKVYHEAVADKVAIGRITAARARIRLKLVPELIPIPVESAG